MDKPHDRPENFTKFRSKMHLVIFIVKTRASRHLKSVVVTPVFMFLTKRHQNLCQNHHPPPRKKSFSWSFLFLGIQVDGHDESIQSQNLSENQNQDHSHEKPGLLRCPSDPGISHNPNSIPSSKT